MVEITVIAGVVLFCYVGIGLFCAWRWTRGYDG